MLDPPARNAEFVETVFNGLNLALSVLLVPCMRLVGTPFRKGANLGSSREVADHCALKRTVKGQNNPLPGAARALGLKEAQCTVLQGRQHIETFVRMHESAHAQDLRCGPPTDPTEKALQ